MRKIHIANDKKRDAEVGFEMCAPKSTIRLRTADRRGFANARVLKSTLATDADTILQKHPDAAADLAAADPEIDLEQAGRFLEDVSRVYINAKGEVAHAVSRTENVYAPDGTLKLSRPAAEISANIADEKMPLFWTGKMVPMAEALRRFVFVRNYQLRHVSGLTFDFLYDMAKKLCDSHSLMLIGGGSKGAAPLVLSNNGTAYRAFLEGRVDGGKYALILHLTNLELKAI